MMKIYPVNETNSLKNQEKALRDLIFSESEADRHKPKETSVNFILNYSKALSIRKSANSERKVEMILN